MSEHLPPVKRPRLRDVVPRRQSASSPAEAGSGSIPATAFVRDAVNVSPSASEGRSDRLRILVFPRRPNGRQWGRRCSRRRNGRPPAYVWPRQRIPTDADGQLDDVRLRLTVEWGVYALHAAQSVRIVVFGDVAVERHQERIRLSVARAGTDDVRLRLQCLIV